MATKEDCEDYGVNESSKPGYVRVRVGVEGLKAKKPGIIRPKKRNNQAENATIECLFLDRAFTVLLTGGITFKFERKNLLHSIIPSESYWKTEDNNIFVFLKKASNDDDWSPALEKGKLEAE